MIVDVDIVRAELGHALPAAALDDYAEYVRQGGRFGIAVWWDRYRDDYQRQDGAA